MTRLRIQNGKLKNKNKNSQLLNSFFYMDNLVSSEPTDKKYLSDNTAHLHKATNIY